MMMALSDGKKSEQPQQLVHSEAHMGKRGGKTYVVGVEVVFGGIGHVCVEKK
jgi:hypothetical protein